MHPRLAAFLAACCTLLLISSGCGDARPEPLPDTGRQLAEDLRAHYQASTSFDVELRIWVFLPDDDDDPRRFRLQVESHPDVGDVLHGFELGVSLFDGELADDGELLLMIESERLTGREEVVVGNLLAAAEALERDIAESPVTLFIGRLPQIIDEIARGPVPVSEHYQLDTTDTGATRLRCIDQDVESWCILGPANERVAEKIVFVREDDGERRELVRITYHRHLVMDTLLRARDIRITLPGDPTRIRVKISTLDQVSTNDPPRRPEVPEDLPQVALDAWLQAFIDAEREATKRDAAQDAVDDGAAIAP